MILLCFVFFVFFLTFFIKPYVVSTALFVCVEVYGPVNPMGSCQGRSVYLTTLLLGRLSPLSGWPVLCTFFRQKLTFLNQRKGENDSRKYVISLFTKECCRPRLTALECMDRQVNVHVIQMGTYNICLYKVDKKYSGCNQKTMEFLIGSMCGN